MVNRNIDTPSLIIYSIVALVWICAAGAGCFYCFRKVFRILSYESTHLDVELKSPKQRKKDYQTYSLSCALFLLSHFSEVFILTIVYQYEFAVLIL